MSDIVIVIGGIGIALVSFAIGTFVGGFWMTH